METNIRPVTENDWDPIARIFNHYVHNSQAAFPDQPVGEDFFKERRVTAPDYPFVVVELDDEVIGFGYLRPFHTAATMRRTATLTYFLDPNHTGSGVGSILVDYLIAEGQSMGVDNFLAHISSLNGGSIRFHAQHGFTECGRFRNVGRKAGQNFDMVWMQRIDG